LPITDKLQNRQGYADNHVDWQHSINLR